MSSPYLVLLRLKTLSVALAPLCLSQFLAYQTAYFNLAIALLVLLCGVSLQLVSNVANDYFDHQNGFDTAQRLGPLRVSQQGLLSSQQVKRVMLILLVLALASGLVLILYRSIYLLLAGAGAVVLAFWYSASSKSLASLGLGEVTVFLVFGPLALMGGFYVQTGFINLSSFYFSLSFGLLAAALMLVNNTRDYESDKACGKRTLVVRYLGPEYGRFTYIASLLFAGLVNVLVLQSLGLAAVFSIAAVLAYLPLGILMRVLPPAQLQLLMPLTTATVLLTSLALMIDLSLG